MLWNNNKKLEIDSPFSPDKNATNQTTIPKGKATSNSSLRNMNINMNNTFNHLSSDRMQSPTKDLSSYGTKTYRNSPYNKKGKNTIDHTHNLQISSEFRKTLKMKLTKNSNKIFANLKRLSKSNMGKTKNMSSLTHRIDDSRVSNIDEGEYKNSVMSARIGNNDISHPNIPNHQEEENYDRCIYNIYVI